MNGKRIWIGNREIDIGQRICDVSIGKQRIYPIQFWCDQRWLAGNIKKNKWRIFPQATFDYWRASASFHYSTWRFHHERWWKLDLNVLEQTQEKWWLFFLIWLEQKWGDDWDDPAKRGVDPMIPETELHLANDERNSAIYILSGWWFQPLWNILYS